MDRNEIAWLQRIESEIHDDKIALAKTATRLEVVATVLSKIASRLEEIKSETLPGDDRKNGTNDLRI